MILVLGTNNCLVTDFFINNNIKFIFTDEKINTNFLIDNKVTLIISYRYRHIIKKNIIDLNIRIINLHISYLPWNKGADPNFWSIIENTTKGITIHYIDYGIDTGDIIYQKKFEFNHEETLSSTYKKLNYEIQQMFIDNFQDIYENKCPRISQIENAGNHHFSKDKEKFLEKITNNGGWEITIKKLLEIIN